MSERKAATRNHPPSAVDAPPEPVGVTVVKRYWWDVGFAAVDDPDQDEPESRELLQERLFTLQDLVASIVELQFPFRIEVIQYARDAKRGTIER